MGIKKQCTRAEISKFLKKLEQKFEIKEENSRHRRIKLYRNGQCVVRTSISHDNSLHIEGMKTDFHLYNTKKMKNLIECPLSIDEYLNILEEKNKL